jgi:hypothetical protein
MAKLDLDALVGGLKTPTRPGRSRRTLDLDALVEKPAARQGVGSAPQAPKSQATHQETLGPTKPIAADADLYKALSPYMRKAQALLSFLQGKGREPLASVRTYVGDGKMEVLDLRTNRVYLTGRNSYVVIPTNRKGDPKTWKDTKADDHFDFSESKEITVNGIIFGTTKTNTGKPLAPRLVRLTDGFFILHVNPVFLLTAMLAVRAPGHSPRILASKSKPYMANLPILGVEGPGGLALVALVRTS